MASAFRHRARVLIVPLIRLSLWFVLWLLGLVFLLLGLALSPWGTGWLIAQGEQRGLLSVESVVGSPLDELTLTELSLQAGPADIHIGRLHLAWADDCLLDGKLCLDVLQLEHVDVRVEETAPASEPPPEPAGGGGLPSIAVPFPIELRALELRDVDVRLADGTQLSWQRFTSGARIDGDALTLLPTRLIAPRLRLPVSPGQTLAFGNRQSGEAGTPGDTQGQGNVAPSAEQAPGTALTADAIDSAIALATPPSESLPAVAEESSAETAVPLSEREPLDLPDIRLPIAVNVPSLIVEDFRLEGPTSYVVERLALRLQARGHDVHLNSLSVSTADADAELAANVSLRDDYPLDISLNARIHRPPVRGETIALTLDGSLADLNAELQASGPVAATLKAQADVLAPTLPFQVTLNAEQIDWPLADAPGVPAAEKQARTQQAPPQPAESASNESSGEESESAAGSTSQQPDSYRVRDLTLHAEGDLSHYTAALSAAVTGTTLPEEVRLAMAGEGDLERFAWRPLSVAAGEGALISRGEIRWAPALDVTATLRLDRFALDAVTDAVSGTLNGDARVHFAMGEQGWELDVPQLAIDGTLQERPLALNAQLSGNSDMRWIIDQLELRQGQNSLTAEGRIAESMTLSGELNAPALATLLPELGGRLNGRFALDGTLEAPQLDLALSGEALRYAANSLDSLNLDATVSGLDDPDLDVALDIGGLNAAGQRFKRLDLDLDGRLSQHRLTFSANAAEDMPLARASLALEGGLNAARDRYRGRLLSLEVDSEQAELRLAEPTAFNANLAAGSVTVEPFCLVRRQGGSLCLVETLMASAQRGNAQLALRDVPMDLLAAALPEGWSAEGQTDGEVRVEWSAGGRQWSADANVQSRLALSGQDAYGQPWSLPVSTLALNLDATQAQAQLTTDLTLAEAGRIQLDVQVDDPAGAAALEGRLRLDDIRLSPYRTLVTGLQQLEGAINGDVTLSGDLSNPRLNGQLALTGLRAQGGDIPLEVRDGRLEIALRGDNATLQGFIAAEEGRLNIQGDASWPQPGQWQAELALDGSESPLLVVLPAFGRLKVAPDLTINASPELLRIRGQVRVPWGRLEVADMPPSAVSPSSDAVIITREDEAEARREAQQAIEQAGEGADEATAQALADAGMQLDVRIEVILGPDVRLEAYGLEAMLEGELQVRQGSGPVQLFGDVNLVNGRFEAFGQDLIIRQGEVLFSGPASQPRLQLEAIRNPEVTEDDVIAGLRVTGPASQPSLEIFSEPAMNESRALSYLLRGRAPDDSGGADSALTSALIGLSLSRTGGAVGQLGQAFGVEDLSLDTAGSGDDSQVVVSGYLFEDLKVSYGVGIFSPIAELTLRYKLLQNLYLEAVSGAAQAVDLIYAFSLGRSDDAP